MRRLFVPVFFGLVIALGIPSVQAGNQEEANKIAQRLTQQYPQYNIEVAYQEGKVRLRGEVGSETERAEIANFVRRIPKVRSVSETMTVAPYAQAVPQIQYAEPATGIRPVQAVTPAIPQQQPVVVEYGGAPIAATNEYAAPVAPAMPAMPAAPAATRSPSDFFAAEGYNTVAAQNGQPNLPNHAWPSYAEYPNYSQVAYPKQYAGNAFPYIGPFYPYPEVPMGWRKVTMEWHDGYWWLDFNDGSSKGPFSPLFRQPSSYRK